MSDTARVTSDGKIEASFSFSSDEELFTKIAGFQEVFCDTKCKKCNKGTGKFTVRNVDKYTYYEHKCDNPNCKARRAFGKTQEGQNFFPKRKDSDSGAWLPDDGWVIYDAKTGKTK